MIRRLLVLCVSLAVLPRAVRRAAAVTSDPKTVDGFPAYVTTNDEKGAQNFARYWIDTLNEATTSGDTEEAQDAAEGQLRRPARTSPSSSTTSTAPAVTSRPTASRSRRSSTRPACPSPAPGVSVVLTATPQKVYETKGARRA